MKKRIFLALPISDTFKKEIEKWKEKFKNAQPEVFNKIRWLPSENLHITLIPPFYEDDEGIKNVIGSFANVQGEIGEFQFNFEKISYGPTVYHPRLVWISGESSKAAEDLKNSLETLLRLSRDNRPFSPHITIGRFRERDYRFFSLKKLDVPFLYTEKFKEFLLMESRTLPEGAEYKVLGKFEIKI